MNGDNLMLQIQTRRLVNVATERLSKNDVHYVAKWKNFMATDN